MRSIERIIHALWQRATGTSMRMTKVAWMPGCRETGSVPPPVSDVQMDQIYQEDGKDCKATVVVASPLSGMQMQFLDHHNHHLSIWTRLWSRLNKRCNNLATCSNADIVDTSYSSIMRQIKLRVR